MILRRITSAFKRQDWFTVGIETMIVVLGVFLGLQVNNWNAARLDRQETRTVLARLQQDFEIQLAYTRRQVEGSRKALEASSRLIHGIRAGKLDEKTLMQDSFDCFSMPGLPGPSTTFQELVSSGRMDLIHDEELRSRLYSYDSFITLIRGMYPSLSQPLTDLQQQMMKVETITATGKPTDEFDQLGRIDSVNGVAMLDDRPLYEALQRSYVMQDYLHLTLVGDIKTIEHILELLKQAQEKAK